MIVVCEPQCKGISHEKVNSGFLYGLRLAYPSEKIIFIAEKSHYKAIKEIFNADKKYFEGIEHFPVNFNAEISFSLEGIVTYYLLIKKIFDKLISVQANKIFFLSTNPIILFVIKNLKKHNKYKNINCTFVLHGEMEDIANKKYKEPYVPIIMGRSVAKNYYYMFLRYIKHPEFFGRLLSSIFLFPIKKIYLIYTRFFKENFRTKKIMEWKHSKQYHYISLSPHITKNASKFLNVVKLNIYTIVMPIIFAKPIMQSKNKYAKFAVFGYGDSAQMYKMLNLLSKRKIKKKYEIKIISMDGRGTEEFANIKHIGGGKVLTRKEMEKAAEDVDIFINLYDKDRHKFGCSLSIFEALSYLKPVLHLSNPGYNYFNKRVKPIGYRCQNLKEFVDKMQDIIENYPIYKKRLGYFRKNILILRKRYDIENNLDKLMVSFTFT